jgi:hypothetical protein
MQTIHVNRKPLNVKDYTFRVAEAADCDNVIAEPALVYEGAELKIAYVELTERLPKIVKALEHVNYEATCRTAGLPTYSRIIGYAPRSTLRKDFCSSTGLANEMPEEHQAICEGGKIASRYYAQVNPALHYQHQSTVKARVKPQWTIDQSVFTSGIINKNNPLRYHFDGGNFSDVWSAMLVFKKDCNGGGLNVPQYGLHFKLNDHSLLMFDGQGLLHGVTPFHLATPRGYRYSIVYYSLKQMWNCLTPKEELARIRSVKTRRERVRAGIK